MNLNDLEELKRLDPQNTLASTEQYALQLEAALEQVKRIDVPEDYGNFSSIVFQ